MAGGLQYGLPKCGYCGAESRQKFTPPSSSGRKNTRLQHTRFRVCRNGHGFVHKRR
jgi:hypothetical protein